MRIEGREFAEGALRSGIEAAKLVLGSCGLVVYPRPQVRLASAAQARESADEASA